MTSLFPGAGTVLNVLTVLIGAGLGMLVATKGAPEPERVSLGTRVRLVLQDLGPSFIKLGQIGSTRPDLLPAEVIVELKKLQDDVPSEPFEAIQTTVVIELLGADEAPGVVEGGVLSQETRELNIEALPGDIPDVIQHDVAHLEINETELLSAVTAPQGVTFLDDLEETVVATITPPTVEPVEEEIETETAVVGEAAEAPAEAAEEAAEASSEES